MGRVVTDRNQMRISFITLCLFLMVACGCSTVTPIEHGAFPSIVLSENQVAHHAAFASVKIPAGNYEAGYKTDKGTYYLCPTKLVVHGILDGHYAAASGGIFIPAPNSRDTRQGVWFDEYGTSRVFRFSEPLAFQYVSH